MPATGADVVFSEEADVIKNPKTLAVAAAVSAVLVMRATYLSVGSNSYWQS